MAKKPKRDLEKAYSTSDLSKRTMRLLIKKSIIFSFYGFFNFLLKPASPIRPVPKRSMVVGSGTGFEPV